MKTPSIIKVSEAELALARKAKGGCPSKPKKPKSQTERSLVAYIGRYNVWAKKVKEQAKKGRAIKAVVDGLGSLKAKVRSL